MIDLSGHTMGELLQSMLLRVTEQVNKREGSLIRTALSAAAWAIEGLYIDLIDVQKNAFGTTAVGDYLDLKAEERGVTRLPATSAVYYMIANISGITVGFQLADSQQNTWEVTSYVGPDGDNFKYIIKCVNPGEITEPTGQLRPLSFISGLSNAVFGDMITSGSDIEDDNSLRRRYLESLVEISFAGNIASYRETMLAMKYDVAGVESIIGALQVFPITNASGAREEGHVKIWILNDDLEVASPALVDAVQEAVCPMYNGVPQNTGYGIAPICACVHIASVTSTPVLRIDVTISLNNGFSLDSVKPEILSNIQQYITSQKKSWLNQVPFNSNTTKVVIREAFIYSAAIVDGVSDVTNVEIYKDLTLASGSISWDTTGAVFEWIDDDQTIINITT